LPALFPAPYELGLRRLRDRFGVEPVEYPTTRAAGTSPAARAADIHAAFADPSIKAVIASIGGEDQLKVLAHLDPELLRAHPKPFFGYSDNTNLLHFLWNQGIVGYHGGAVMVQWGRPGRMHPVTEESLRRALFTSGDYELPMPAETTDEEQCDWAEPTTLDREPALTPAEPWRWHGPETHAEGAAWGGCLEVIDFQLRASRYVGSPEDYGGSVLFLETSEELPPATYVYRVLMGMGERGMLRKFPAVLVGRPKAWSVDSRNPPEVKRRYAEEQRQAILRAISEYNPQAIVVFNIDFGHTDPQVVIPHGGHVRVDAVARRIAVMY
jgi:muramoyltetrapeptide carboxypeptidase LdcA involved in peptidoglycan recycling